LSIIFGIFYFFGIIDLVLLISITAIVFFLQWIISPYISDIVFRLFYGLRWISIDELRSKDNELVSFIESICEKNRIKFPKIGFIDDDNPQTFAYGSASFNARVVFTRGILTYLNTEERKAVFAHEIGHIVNKDFIIMTLAAFLLAILYHMYQTLLKNGRETKNRRKGSFYVFFLGIIAYIFYLIGNYLLLFLSRVREYTADEFAAKSMKNSNPLASALIKISYGIISNPDEKKQIEFMKGIRTLGIVDYFNAQQIGVSYYFLKNLDNSEFLEKTFLFDLKNPWAFIIELRSSHPLTAKRIKRLDKIYDVSFFDIKKIESYKIDKSKLYSNFFNDILFLILPYLYIVLYVIILFLDFIGLVKIPFSLFEKTILSLIGMGIVLYSIVSYRYRSGGFEKKSVADLMSDVYASPLKGKPVELEGEIIGRGVPGLIFSEDMVFRDKTGIIYLNYEGIVPFLSNLVFAFFKLDNLIGKNVKIRGWFIRGGNARIELDEIITEDGKRIRSRVRIWFIISGIFFFFIILFLSIVYYLVDLFIKVIRS
ncbi:MAG: M48 family metalloprotease, partial [Candidatus Aenigmarchaeota archaeon]|nr:M48 family metalloprotease [Candidatus Aenigmarchaeota archaeon]MDW8149195.1 M48 family metalloprotease [Candidatus Aenigmarchaeota archaeon]